MIRTSSAPFSQHSSRRAGLLTPMIAIALLVAMAAAALVFDRLWLESASVELLTAAEAAATAAAGSLADDSLLRLHPDHEARADDARELAVQVAGENLTTGQPVELANDEDIRLGRLVQQPDGQIRLIETDYFPTTVAVRAVRSRSRNNPVALFIRGLTGQPTADVVRVAEATLDDRVLALRPVGGGPLPLLPLAVLESRSGQNQTDSQNLTDDETAENTTAGHPLQAETWQEQIEQRLGADDFHWDPERRVITRQADGIPEIVLTIPLPRQSDRSRLNVTVVDLGTDLRPAGLARQVAEGVTANDLRSLGGLLRNEDNRRPLLHAGGMLPEDMLRALRRNLGRCRAILLYREFETTGDGLEGRLSWNRLAAARVMDVRRAEDGGFEVVLQPGILVTRTALLPDDVTEFTEDDIEAADRISADSSRVDDSGTADTGARNTATFSYIYKVHLTH